MFPFTCPDASRRAQCRLTCGRSAWSSTSCHLLVVMGSRGFVSQHSLARGPKGALGLAFLLVSIQNNEFMVFGITTPNQLKVLRAGRDGSG